MKIDRAVFLALALGANACGGGASSAPATTPKDPVTTVSKTGPTTEAAVAPHNECVGWDPKGECNKWEPTKECVAWGPTNECSKWEPRKE